MRKIQFICDKCFKQVGMQVLVYRELEKSYLHTVGNQEWCYPCFSESGLPLHFPEKFKIMTPEEIEQYVKS